MKSTAIICVMLVLITSGEAQVRKCLEDSDCHSNECCAQAFYLFRCEKRGYNIGDHCGLCGCANGYNCVAEGLNPFKILSGRGHCRYQAPPPPIEPIFSVRPNKTRPSSTPRPSSNNSQKIPNGRSTKAPILKPKPAKPSRDHFYETFQPIYEQFIELAVSVAGLSLDDLDKENPTSTTKP